MLVALAVRQLHEAQPVAAGDQAHGFGIDRDRTVGKDDFGRQVFLVKINSHSYSCTALHDRFSPRAAVHASPEESARWIQILEPMIFLS